MNLTVLVELVNATAERVFASRGGLYPMYFMVTEEGESLVVPEPPGDKDESVALLRGYMSTQNVVRYVSVKEAWTVHLIATTTADVTKAVADINNMGGCQAHPDRVEVLMLIAEDRSEGCRTYHRDIARIPGKPARLGPLVRDEYTQSEGRFVGLLPRPEGVRLQ
jgi:hypothetical protein